jgi:hypothetical protein
MVVQGLKMVNSIPTEMFPLLLIFSAIFLILRIFKIGIKASVILAGVLTFIFPLLIENKLPGLFDEFYNLVLGFGKFEIGIFSLFLIFVGLLVGRKPSKKFRKLTDIEILGKLEFKKADLVGKLSLARAKKDKRAEKTIKKELEKVEKEIATLKKKLGRYI